MVTPVLGELVPEEVLSPLDVLVRLILALIGNAVGDRVVPSNETLLQSLLGTIGVISCHSGLGLVDVSLGGSLGILTNRAGSPSGSIGIGNDGVAGLGVVSDLTTSNGSTDLRSSVGASRTGGASKVVGRSGVVDLRELILGRTSLFTSFDGSASEEVATDELDVREELPSFRVGEDEG